MADDRHSSAGKRLDSWKEIAAFLGRAERTVKRWETERGLPVHRVPGSARGSVFGYSGELLDWLEGRSHELDADEATVHDNGEGGAAPTGSLEVVTRSSLAKARVGAALVLAASVVAVAFFVGQQWNLKALASKPAPKAEARDLYLKGRYYWERRTPDDLNKAVDYFTQAIVRDPLDAEAYVGLADCYNLLREFGAMPPAEAYPRALAAAQRAVQLDDTSAEAHNSLAFVSYWWLWQGTTAEREFKRALELNPNFARAHHWYGTYLIGRHRGQEALDQLEQAQRLEPSSSAILADKGLLLGLTGRENESLALLEQLAKAEPTLSSTHDYIGRVLWERKDYRSALAESKRSAELRHDQAALTLINAKREGLAASGLKGMWESELPVQKELFSRGYGTAFGLAETCAALGKTEEALAYLQMSLDRREASLLVGDPIPALSEAPAYQRITAAVKEQLAK